MALGNDLDSKIVEIYQEYLKKQKDEKVADRVYASEEVFRNGLEEVIKLNGIVDKSEFYTAIAFEIQNGNFSISSDGKIDLTSESITKAVERAKEAENKKINVNDANEDESKKIPIEKGIFGITEIKTIEDARKVLSARIKTEDMTPEKAKLTKDALAFSFKELMSETEATETAAEVVEMATAPEDITPETAKSFIHPDIKLKKEDLDFIIAFSNTDYVKNNVQGTDDRFYASFSFFLQLQKDLPPNLAAQIKQNITRYMETNFGEKAGDMSWLLFAKSGEEYHFDYVNQLIVQMKKLEKDKLLTEENVEDVVNRILNDMETAGITITPEMREEAKKIIANPTMVTKISDNRLSRQQEWAEIEGQAQNTFQIFNRNCDNGIDWKSKCTEEFAQYVSQQQPQSIPSGAEEQIKSGKTYITSSGAEQGDGVLDAYVPKAAKYSSYEEIAEGIDTGILRNNSDVTSTMVDKIINSYSSIERTPRNPSDVDLSEFMKSSYKKYVDDQTGKKVPRNVEDDRGIFIDKAFDPQSAKTEIGMDFDAIEAEMGAFFGEIGDGGDDMFAAMFAGMAEDMTVGSTEVEHEPEVEGEVEVVEDAPIDAAAASGLVAEDVVIGEASSKVNEVPVPPVINEPVAEVVEEPKSPEQPGMLAVDTLSNKIKRGLNELGKKVKGVFGKIAGLFGGGNSDSGNNTGTNGTGGIVQDTKDPKTSQAPGQDFIQHVDLSFEFLKGASTETRADETKPKGVDDQTQGFEVDD